jgi:hypothetical protein
MSLRVCVVLAAAVIGFAAASCPSSSTAVYSNYTGCTGLSTLYGSLCTCTGSVWNSTSGNCTWGSSSNCSAASTCLSTYTAGVYTFITAGSLSTTCSSDLTVLKANLSNFEAGTSSLWNVTNIYSACVAFACPILTQVAGSACSSYTSCPSPLSSTVYLTFAGNWSGLIPASSRRARARSTASYNNLKAALSLDITKITGYVPTSVSMLLTTTLQCLATVVLPISSSAKTSLLTVLAGTGALALFSDLSAVFTTAGGSGFGFIGAGTSPAGITPAPTTPTPSTPSPSGASVATVAHAVLAVVAMLLLA